MFKNKIKAIKIGFLLVCILPNICQALDKEDLFKFLVKTAYPEVKVIDDDYDEDNIDSSNNSLDNAENDEEFINIYVGEENKPAINKDGSITTASLNKNEMTVSKEDPQMLIYHTHSSETYSDSPENNYHSLDIEHSVMSVGNLLSSELSQRGWGVVHTTKYNDLEYNKSYITSAQALKSILEEYKSVKVAIDLHRDGRNIDTNDKKQTMHDEYTTEINGETVAKFFLVVGQRNENFESLKKQAEEITALAEAKYPGLVAPVVTKQYGKFNQYIAENGLLIEVGNNATSIKEAQGTCKYLAEILDEYYSDIK